LGKVELIFTAKLGMPTGQKLKNKLGALLISFGDDADNIQIVEILLNDLRRAKIRSGLKQANYTIQLDS
jgi:hypothetical protein